MPAPSPTAVTLRDGIRLTVRPLRRDDRGLIAGAFERMSDRSRFLRFFAPVPRLPRRTLDALMDVDDVRHVALIALHEDACAGVVRYVRDRDDPALAHLAVTVVDAYHGRGLGRALIEALRDVAAVRGIHGLVLDIHPDNHVMTGLARSLGVRLGYRDGAVHGVLEVRGEQLLNAA